MILKMWKDFDEMVFNVAEADGKMSIQELKDSSVYDFYRHKELIRAKIARLKKKN